MNHGRNSEKCVLGSSDAPFADTGMSNEEMGMMML